MLRLFHTADWHLGHHLHGVSRHFEHRQFLAWLLQTLQDRQADALIVAGDIFDTANPPAAAQAQLYEFLVKARTQQPQLDIVLIGGNHDSASRLDAPSPILKALGVHVVGGLVRKQDGKIDWDRLIVPLTDAQGVTRAWCGAMPFLRNADLSGNGETEDPLIAGVKELYGQLFEALQKKAGNGERLILTGHCYMVNGSVSELSERKILGGNQHALPVDIFPGDIAYVALGHLHLAQKAGPHEHIRYSGSPIPLSFDEAGYRHQVVQVDVEDGRVETTTVQIPRSVEMIRIPDGKDFAALSGVIAQLKSLDLDPNLPIEQTPFVELRILLDKPEPGLRQQIEEAIAGLPLRLLKISTACRGSQQSLADVNIEQRLEELQPLDVFQRCYQNRYDQDAPEALTALFNELIESVQGGD
ncbi:exonuclease SbcCD subunit D C-terminal domain-containing protein [Methylobacter sp. YRD-M1]|uniref:exonuclease SbcCD subunit D C-terminal domain-containing protein n=1 Tax=Methylobacter sp. YRD-M1 TaxID=2911520 RepID=UPI00227D2698|nr:exonuclease SbcCD subunit D C-terminal domain-containing protein [Methylobacter sp. YRD-M1]WAK03469.1 exonuclease SbcCD subunit D C-terminal domain-containing protein [Methylobacter sp. YRD-M1]